MVRDVTGTCRETCIEVKYEGKKRVETPIPNCYILLGVTYHNWCNEKDCTKTMFNKYWHAQKWKANNIFKNHQISLNNYDSRVKCMTGVKKIRIVPYCTTERTRECAKDFGY